ncbi:MAG: hypothetical protein R3C68_10680 [Myxococcota bacterium]
MSKIGSGGVPPKAPGLSPADFQGKQPAQTTKQAPGSPKLDSFQRTGTAVESVLQTTDGKMLAQKLQFSNEDLAMLAKTFALVLRQHPNADRRKRSRLFAKTILKRRGKKGFGDLLDEDNEEHSEHDRKSLEEMYDMIADQLDSTPVFAQLVDEITESARKIR